MTLLFADLAIARGKGRLPRMLATVERTRLLIIDDWGPEPLTAKQERDGDMSLGNAILDHVVHRAHRLKLKGAGLCKRHAGFLTISVIEVK